MLSAQDRTRIQAKWVESRSHAVSVAKTGDVKSVQGRRTQLMREMNTSGNIEENREKQSHSLANNSGIPDQGSSNDNRDLGGRRQGRHAPAAQKRSLPRDRGAEHQAVLGTVVVRGLVARRIEAELEPGIVLRRVSLQPMRYSRAASDSPNPAFGVPV